MSGRRATRVLAACYRSSALSLMVFDGTRLVIALTHRFDGRRRGTRFGELLRRATADYAVDVAVVEPDGALKDAAHRAGRLVKTLTIAEAKAVLLPGAMKPTHRELYERIVRDRPEFRRFVPIIAATSRVAMSDRRRTVPLLAAALGLAFSRWEDRDT